MENSKINRQESDIHDEQLTRVIKHVSTITENNNYKLS